MSDPKDQLVKKNENKLKFNAKFFSPTTCVMRDSFLKAHFCGSNKFEHVIWRLFFVICIGYLIGIVFQACPFFGLIKIVYF